MKIKKFIIALAVCSLCLAFLNCNIVMADKIGDLEDDATSFISKGSKEAGTSDKVISSVTNNFRPLGRVLTMIGAGILVIVITYMGIKYLISPPDKQAALKQQLIGVAVSGVVIFGAYGIWAALVRLFSKLD